MPEGRKLPPDNGPDRNSLLNENAHLRRLAKLYEMSSVISASLDYDRFYKALIDSILQAVGGNSALVISSDDDIFQAPNLKAFKGLSEEEASLVSDRIIKECLQNPVSDIMIMDNPRALPKSGSLLLIPVGKRSRIQAYVAVILENKDIDRQMIVESALFISTHASASLENVELYNQAKQLTYIDDATKLHNVRYMAEALENEIKRANRFNFSLSVLFVDIDHFKAINDTYGHGIGSRALFEVAQLLKELVREVDIVVRYGGDEMVILLVETESVGALAIAERIRSAAENHVFLAGENRPIRFTLTIGVAAYPEQAQTKEELLMMADEAMYEGKKEGRNKVVFADKAYMRRLV